MVATLRHTAPKLGKCCRCYLPKPATTSVDLEFAGEAYLLRLCEEHADMLQTAMFSWTRVGEIVLPIQARATVESRSPAAHHGANGRVPVPAPIAVEDEPEVEEPAPIWLDHVPQNVVDLARSAPGVRDWRLTRKARERADEAGVDLLAVLLAAEAPEDIAPSAKDPDVCLHTRAGVTAIVNAQTKVVLTMFRKEEPIRGNQAS
jgi:hypothetical protein